MSEDPESYDEYISKRLDEQDRQSDFNRLDKTPNINAAKYKGAAANSDISNYKAKDHLEEFRDTKNSYMTMKRDEYVYQGFPGFPAPLPTDQKFDESKYLAEIQDYLAGTYKAHYATGNVQAFELVASSGLAAGFTMGSVLKYASRYGKKNGHNRKDLLKIIHYALLQLWVHDKEGYDNGKETRKETR